MLKNLWNIGAKVMNLEAELGFFQRLGAQPILREKLAGDDSGAEYAIVSLGGARLSLFPQVMFEDRVAGGVAPGLTHVVYETDDVEKAFERLQAAGGEVLIEPTFARGGFGSRRLAFLRSPGGVVIEVMQVLEDKLG